ncbi:MAG: TonB-dependent receptor, partial [Bryobacterales bacterium]
DGNTISLNGLPPRGFTFSVDGVDAAPDPEFPSLSLYQNFNLIKGVSMDAVQEVETSKNIFSAEIYHAVSGNVNLITKSGTNEFHGSLFENYQAGGLNANNHLVARKSPLVMHQFGGSIGGPIIRDKLFFFTAFEGYRRNEAQALSGQVPSRWIREQATAAIPESAAYWDFWPLPTGPEQPGNVDASFVGTDSLKFEDEHTSTRADWHINSNNFIQGRFTWGNPYRRQPRLIIGNGRVHDGMNVNISSTYTRVWSPTVTSETRFGYNRADVDRIDQIWEQGIPVLTGFGIPSTGGELFTKKGSTSTIDQSFAKIAGKHSLKVGGVLRWGFSRRINEEVPIYEYSSLADINANQPASARFIFPLEEFEISRWFGGFFVQDDIRMTQRLTVNLGLRWDYSAVPRERDDRLFNRQSPYGPYLPADEAWNAAYSMWSPRASAAYSLNDKTVVRFGAGIFYIPFNLFSGPVEIVKNGLSVPTEATLSQDQLGGLGVTYPDGNESVRSAVQASNIIGDSIIDPNWENSYSIQWNFGIQRQLTESLAWEVSYVANRGLKLIYSPDWNRQDRVTGLRENAGYSQFRFYQSADASSYHSLQSSLKKRFAKGLLFNWNYTYASNTSFFRGNYECCGANENPQDLNDMFANKGATPYHIRHRTTIDWLYELPFGQNSTGATRMILGGWQISGVWEARSGLPLLIRQSTGGPGQRPDIIASSHEAAAFDNYSEPLTNGTYQYLDRAAFAPIALNDSRTRAVRAGNLSRNAIYGPGRWGVDLALSKSFIFNERHRLRFQAEWFNATNHTNFSGIQTDVLSSAFGRVTSTEPGRVTQLSVRYEF